MCLHLDCNWPNGLQSTDCIIRTKDNICQVNIEKVFFLVKKKKTEVELALVEYLFGHKVGHAKQ